MQVTGPFAVAANEEYDKSQPTPQQLAVIVMNNSPYQLTVAFSDKSYTISPYMQDLLLKPPNVNTLQISTTALSGTVPTGANSEVTLVWLNNNDHIDVRLAAHPVPITPNSVASGSTISGSVEVTNCATATISTAASSTTTATIAAANSARRGLILANNSTEPCVFAFGSGASATNFSIALAAGASIAIPAPVYTGLISVVWATAGTGNATVTELQ